MTDLLHEPEAERDEAELRDEAIAESLAAMRPEPETGEPEQENEEVAPTDTPGEALEPEEPEPPQEPEETEEERELRQARVIAREIREHPELGDALVAIKQGAVPIDRSVLEAAQAFMAQRQESPAETDDLEERFWADPIAVVRELHEWRQQQEAERAQFTQQRAQMEYQENGNLLTSVGEEWQSTHPGLSDEHVQRIVQRTEAAGLIAYRYNQHGDKARAIREGLEDGLRLEYPELTQAAARDEALRAANRSRRAGMTAASPRSAPRSPEERPTPRNSAERVQFLADEIRALDTAQQ